MNVHRSADTEGLARAAADHLTRACHAAVQARGQFLLALSGGSTPWKMLAVWANADVPWQHVHLFQVDERVAPGGHQDRNWTHLTDSLLDGLPSGVEIPVGNLHPMPVNEVDGPSRYENTLREWAGETPVLDLVQLGMGSDGHTASLIPEDPALDVAYQDVAWCGEYQGRKRMTFTFPCLDRAKERLWLIAGESKRDMLDRLLQADQGIPAGRVRREAAVVFTDLQ